MTQPEDGEGPVHVAAGPAGGFGRVVPSGQVQGADGEVSEGGHGPRPGAGADGGAENNVTLPFSSVHAPRITFPSTAMTHSPFPSFLASGEWPGGIAPPGSRRVKWTAGEVPLAGSFSVGLFPNRACKFPRTLLSSDHFGYGLVARPAWMSSWQRRQVIRVLRRRMAIKCIHSGLSRRPGLTRSASLRTWWTSRPAVSSQISQRPARSRKISSLRRVLAMTGRWSVRTAVRARRSGIPPKRVTSGFLPLSRLMTTCRHLRGPAGVSTVALYLRAIALTVERCLPASVLSSEVSMTQCRRPRRNTSWASR